MFAITSLVGAFVLPVVGVVFCHPALHTIKRTGEVRNWLGPGRPTIGYTLIALILGFLILYLTLLFTVFVPLVHTDIATR